MEVVGGRRAVGDLHIIFGAGLQEPLQPGGGVLGPLPFIAVRQQHGQAAHAQPFTLARRDELVDHDLGPVHEIAELSFPHHEVIRADHRISILESEHTGFGQRAVENVEPRAWVAFGLQLGQRRPSFTGDRIVHRSVPL